jgi:alpha-amylase/alpha-mannosidase (GH57 family)
MKKIKLLFGVHMHQPVDNLSEAVENAVNKCYRPFFATLKNFKEFKFALHSSGWLLENIAKNYSDVFDDILELNDAGSIEFFTGGFYEPVLSSIPSKDRLKQIEKLNKFIEKYFNKRPEGLWLTERVWEDSIVTDLVKSNIKYLTVDDYHFIASGFHKDNLDGFYNTENSGEMVSLFPINKSLRYSIPFKKAKEAIKDIKKIYKDGNSAAIIFDDAEKFGLWPKTYSWVYEKGWLEDFLSQVTNDKEIQLMHFSEYYENYKPKGLAYLQNVSYYEMGEWSLKADDTLMLENLKNNLPKEFEEISDMFVKGGTWKNFFIKFEESNRIHKRMLELSKQQSKSPKFKEELYKLQTNDVLWHGVFGGLYLPNLRDNAYKYLCNCENIKYKNKETIEIMDTDLNGYEEIKIVTDDLILRFDSHFGGQLIEFLIRDKSFNLQNTLTRRKEAYHETIKNYEEVENEENTNDEIETIHNAKLEITEEIKNSLDYDWYIKNSFIDHISNDSFTLENFSKCRFWEYGDFANQPFDFEILDNEVIFSRKGGIYFDKTFNTEIIKKYLCKKNKLDFEIRLNTESPYEYIYALEFNLHFADLNNVFLNDENINKQMEISNLKSFSLTDKFTLKEISFKLEKNFNLFICPLKTVSQNEKGFELTTQGVSIAIVFPFNKDFSLKGILEVKDV